MVLYRPMPVIIITHVCVRTTVFDMLKETRLTTLPCERRRQRQQQWRQRRNTRHECSGHGAWTWNTTNTCTRISCVFVCGREAWRRRQRRSRRTYHEHEQQQHQQKQHGFCGVRWRPLALALALAPGVVVVAVADVVVVVVVAVTAGSLGPPNVVVNVPPGWPVPMLRMRYRVGSSTTLQDISAGAWSNRNILYNCGQYDREFHFSVT